MQIHQEVKSETEITVTVSAAEKDLEAIKKLVLRRLQGQVKAPGFRAGKVPLHLVEKQLDSQQLQSQFLEEAVPKLYELAVRELKLRPVVQPKLTLNKFVPFTTLEFMAELAVIGNINLPDYRKIKKIKPAVSVTAKDIDKVITSIQKDRAEKKEVQRPAKMGDEVWIDFAGTDSKDQPIPGAEGKDYPLILGSETFIPGFEANLVGVKADEQRIFTLSFPKNYALKGLAGQKVTFTVSVKKVEEIRLPNIDDVLASQLGPFKTLAELKADIKKQLIAQRQFETERDLEVEIVKEIVAKTKVNLPKVVVDEQLTHDLNEFKQNLTRRGQVYEEFLKAQALSEDKHQTDVLRPQAEERVKTSLVLAEVAAQEKLTVTPEELQARLAQLKEHYKDPQMQAELAKPEAERDIANRLLTEKTLATLRSYALKGAV